MAIEWVGIWSETAAAIDTLVDSEAERDDDVRRAAKRIVAEPDREGTSFKVIAKARLQALAALPDTVVSFKTARGGQSEFLRSIRGVARGLTEMAVEGPRHEWLTIPDKPPDAAAGEFSNVPHNAKVKLNVYVNTLRCKNFGSMTQTLHHELALHAETLARLVRRFKEGKGKVNLQGVLKDIVSPTEEHEGWWNGANAAYIELYEKFQAACVRAGKQQDWDDYSEAEKLDLLASGIARPAWWPRPPAGP